MNITRPHSGAETPQAYHFLGASRLGALETARVRNDGRYNLPFRSSAIFTFNIAHILLITLVFTFPAPLISSPLSL